MLRYNLNLEGVDQRGAAPTLTGIVQALHKYWMTMGMPPCRVRFETYEQMLTSAATRQDSNPRPIMIGTIDKNTLLVKLLCLLALLADAVILQRRLCCFYFEALSIVAI